jgi:acylphosphatase
MTDPVVRGFVVRGRVQGVGFRWWTRKQAQARGLGGIVWNRDDGAVEIHVKGPAREVSAFLRALKAGPRLAEVQTVEEVAPTEQTLGPNFTVTR